MEKPTHKPIFVDKLPKKPKKDQLFERVVDNPKIGTRLVTFQATGKKDFGKYKITKNVKLTRKLAKQYGIDPSKITIRKKQKGQK